MPLGMVLLFLDKKANKNLLLVQSLGIYSFILFLDILVLLFKDNGLSQNSFNQAIYFSGGKFSAIYIYLAWLMLFFQVKKDINRKWAIVLMAIGIIYSYCLDCMTGVVAIFSFGVIMLIPQNLCTGRKGIIWILAVVVITILLVFFQVQTSVLWIKNIITKVLNSSISLTGRVSIYDAIPKIMKDHWMLGWGYTSTRIVQITGLANMQNGFLQLIYNNGVLGTIPFLLVMLIAIKKVIELKDLKIGRVFLASIVSFFVIAIVEIPFNTTSFFLLIACIFMQSNSEINANEFYKGSTDIK
jgi:O-antigen ligase